MLASLRWLFVPALLAGCCGLLVPVGRTRARYYTEGPNFPAAALDLARTPVTLASPYPNL